MRRREFVKIAAAAVASPICGARAAEGNSGGRVSWLQHAQQRGALVTPTITLTPRIGTISSSRDGEVLSGFDLSGRINISHKNVVVENFRLRHVASQGTFSGLSGNNAAGLIVRNGEIIRTDPQPNTGLEANNIGLFNCPDTEILNSKISNGSSNIFVQQSRGVLVSKVELYNAVGPMPRGQNCQFGDSPGCIIEDFLAENFDGKSWTEDNISFFNSPNGIARRGLLIFNNSPSGWGLIAEKGSSGCLFQDTDALAMGCGAFHQADGTSGGTVERCRAKNAHLEASGRGLTESNCLIFGAWPVAVGATKHKFIGCKWFNHPNANIYWDGPNGMAPPIGIAHADFTPRARTAVTLPFV
jgi:hypothetical protein